MITEIWLYFLSALSKDRHPKDLKVLLPTTQKNQFLNIGTCHVNYDPAEGRAYGLINSHQPINPEWYVYVQTNITNGAFEAIILYEESPGFPLTQIKDIFKKS